MVSQQRITEPRSPSTTATRCFSPPGACMAGAVSPRQAHRAQSICTKHCPLPPPSHWLRRPVARRTETRLAAQEGSADVDPPGRRCPRAASAQHHHRHNQSRHLTRPPVSLDTANGSSFCEKPTLLSTIRSDALAGTPPRTWVLAGDRRLSSLASRFFFPLLCLLGAAPGPGAAAWLTQYIDRTEPGTNTPRCHIPYFWCFV